MYFKIKKARKNYKCECKKSCKKRIKKGDKYAFGQEPRQYTFPEEKKYHLDCAKKHLQKEIKKERKNLCDRVRRFRDGLVWGIESKERKVSEINEAKNE